MFKKRFDNIHHREIFLNLFHQKTFLFGFFLLFFLLAVFLIIYFIFPLFNIELVCGDGTSYSECSNSMPYYCSEGKLVEMASVCGCSENLTLQGEACVSQYATRPRDIVLNYTLRGEKGEIDFEIYEGITSYVSKLPRSLSVINGFEPSRADFKFQKIEEEQQMNLLLPLVAKIQNLDVSERDKLRIAVSLVQEIEFGVSDKIVNIAGTQLDYSRYPYEVFLDLQGVCGEKSELLVFILREMGYGVGFFYYPTENHEAVAVKCPKLHSVGWTGYCLIETTGPSIITDKGIEYVNVGKLKSKPEVIVISEGKSMGRFWYEYFDAWNFNRLRKGFAIFKERGIQKLEEKYGLVDVYNP